MNGYSLISSYHVSKLHHQEYEFSLALIDLSLYLHCFLISIMYCTYNFQTLGGKFVNRVENSADP